MYLVRAGAIENIDSFIRLHGLNPIELLAEFNWTVSLLREPETLLSYIKVADFLDYCAAKSQDPLFGFKLTQNQSFLVLGELVALLSQQATFADTIAFFQKYNHLHALGIQLSSKINNEKLEVHYHFDFSNQSGLQQLILLSAGHAYKYAQMLIPEHNNQIAIHTTQNISPECIYTLGDDSDVFRPNSDFNGISFPLSWLSKDVANSNPAIKQYTLQRAAVLNARYPNDLAAQVRFVASNLLSTGECSIESVASALDVQPRALQRRLQKQGMQFRQLLQKVRQLKAEQYLRNSQMSITDIALSLGYSETAVFSRNFKQWTGHTALKWREAQLLNNVKRIG
ncbi:helix-turn-helix transcriptional regulator [Shewanella sp. TC10]|uniref:helix-turn-helix transcriptional regulator n=1 Tax=Shewanella sp. TC10 TaxID=1419739 RepID=UPI00129EB355|nr:AraC family transcriptional regulator [Shewanella sp. TC10]